MKDLVICFLLVFLIVTIASAQQKPKEIEIGEVVVTATRTERPVKDVPNSVTIITKEEMDKMHVKTVDDVLNKVAGIRIKRSMGPCTTGSHTVLLMRGTGSTKRVLVLKDGIPLNDMYGGAVQEFSTLSTEDIERIEIVRGAGSALYGSNAMGGVINIITRPPKEKFEGGLIYEGGEMNTHIYNFNISRATDWIGFRLSAGGRNTNGYQYKKKWKDYYKKPETDRYYVSPEVDFKLGRSKLKFGFEYFDEDDIHAAPTQYDLDTDNYKYHLDYSIPISDIDFNAKFYYFDYDWNLEAYKYNKTTKQFDKFYYKANVPKDNWGLMLQASREIKGLLFTIGSDLKWGKCKSHYLYKKGLRDFEGKQKQYSWFLHAEWPLLKEKLILSAGIRYDWWKNYDGRFYDNTTGKEIAFDYPESTEDRWSPKAGLVYHLTEDTRFRTSFGTGFRAPDLYSLYRSGPHGAALFEIGNPELEPEKMTYSIDFGFDTKPLYELFKVGRDFNLSFTAYWSGFKDFITKKVLEPDEIPPYFTPEEGQEVKQKVNVGKVRIYGIETEIDYTFLKHFKVNVNYTYNVSKVVEHPLAPEIEGKLLTYTPKHIVNWSIIYDNPKLFTISLYCTYMGKVFYDEENKKPIDDYVVGDLRVSRVIPLPKYMRGTMEAFVNVDNIWDEEYRHYYYYYLPGTTVMGGLKYTF